VLGIPSKGNYTRLGQPRNYPLTRLFAFSVSPRSLLRSRVYGTDYFCLLGSALFARLNEVNLFAPYLSEFRYKIQKGIIMRASSNIPRLPIRS